MTGPIAVSPLSDRDPFKSTLIGALNTKVAKYPVPKSAFGKKCATKLDSIRIKDTEIVVSEGNQ